MLIAGANRHVKEVFELLSTQSEQLNLVFYDDISVGMPHLLFGKYLILKSLNEAGEYFKLNNRNFILALGGTDSRKIVADKLISVGGNLSSIISKTAIIGQWDVTLQVGLNIMHNAMISNSVKIGMGTLVNAYCSIHHDTIIGNFCELSPHSVILGGCKIGDLTAIGANATILPNITVGRNVIVGAGAVVIKDVPDGVVVAGVPARVINP